MNISSILITIVGILIILALYVVSRYGQNKLPNNENAIFPDIKDENGNAFTSVLDDIPATDGSTPGVSKETPTKDTSQKHQLVIFISPETDQILDGNLIKKALFANGLRLGDKDIYHYQIEDSFKDSNNNDKQLSSLFRIANGVEPWTLKDHDLDNQKLVGLSMVMLLPNTIENKAALRLYIQTADAIAVQINGVIKNQQQEILSDADREEILNL